MSKSQMKTMLITSFDIKGIVHLYLFHKAKQSTKFIMWKYWSSYMKMCVDKGLNFGPIGFSTMTIFQLLTRCSVRQFLAQKSITEMETPTLFPLFGSKWLLAVTRTKVYLKGQDIRMLKMSKKMWQRWKLFHNSSKNVSNSGSIIGLSSQLLKGSPLKVTPFSKL